MFLHIASLPRWPKNDIKSPPAPLEQSFPQNSCSNLILGLVGLDFGGVRAPLGLSWAPLRRLLGALGRLLTSLGRLFDASWAIGGRSWAFLGWFGPLRGSILAPWASPGLDFKGFGDVPGKVLEAFGSMFWHAFSWTSHFVTKSFFSCSNHVF